MTALSLCIVLEIFNSPLHYSDYESPKTARFIEFDLVAGRLDWPFCGQSNSSKLSPPHPIYQLNGFPAAKWPGAEAPDPALQIQDWKDIGRRKLLGGERMCAYRNRQILRCEGYQQADDAGKGTYGGQSLKAIGVMGRLGVDNADLKIYRSGMRSQCLRRFQWAIKIF